MKILGIIVCIFILSAVCIAEEADYWDWKGGKEMSKGNYSTALADFNKSVSQDPSYVDGWMHKGDAQKALKLYNGSLESYNTVLKLAPDKAESVWNNEASIYDSTGNLKGAFDAVVNATSANPKSAGNWYTAGIYLQRMGNFSAASKYFDNATAINPQYKEAFYRNGLSMYSIGKLTDAISLFDNATAIDPKWTPAYIGKAMALESGGNYAEALNNYNKVLELDKGNAQAKYGKMHMLLVLKKNNDAAIAFINL